MALFNRRISSHTCFLFIVLLSVLPIVRASYSTAAWRLQRAFAKYGLPLLPSAAPDDTALLDTHYSDLAGNYTNYEVADMALQDGDATETELQEAYEAFQGYERAYFQIIADYMGVGWPTTCKDHINTALAAASEWNKAGQQAASTLMALLPLLLTFGNLYVPRSSEAFGTSFVVGLMSAVFGFGLPVKSISAVPVKQTVTLSRLSWRALTDIGRLGQLERKKATPAKLHDLQTWSDSQGSLMFTADNCFAGISHAALDWRSRTHWWHLPSLLVASCQAIILFLCVFPLFMGIGLPTLLMDCTTTVTSVYLIASAVISSVVRFLMWETSSHERVHVFALSESAEEQLREIAGNIPSELSTEMGLPPLQAPLLIRPLQSTKRNLLRFWSAVTRIKRGMAQPQNAPAPPQFPPALSDDRYWMIPLQFTKVITARVHWIITNIVTFFLSGFQNQNAAIRWRPLIVLAHLSTSGRNPLKTLFTGVVEGAVLLLLTFFFAAQWAGNLVVTMYSLAYLLTFVSVARGLGLLYIKWSVRSAGLHVVECESVEEIYGSLRVLCSMKHLLVRVNGAWYFEGNRMDKSPEYWKWEVRSERGEFDEKKSSKVLGGAPASTGPALPPKTPSGQVTAVNHRSSTS